MRTLKDIFENIKTQRVDTATNDGPQITSDDVFTGGTTSPSVSRDTSAANKGKQKSSLRNALAKASANRTSGPRVNQQALNNLPDDGEGDDFDFSDDVGDDPEQTDSTALATQSKGVRAPGKVHADWMGIDQLPGYMQTGIRRLGRIVFKPLTKTKLDDISVLANLGGHGPTERLELNAVARFAVSHATETRDLAMQFGEMVPGYEPEAKLYITPKDTYLVVQDEHGQYVYSWPTKDTKSAFVKHLAQDKPQLD